MKRNFIFALLFAAGLWLLSLPALAGLSAGAASADITPEPEDKLPSSGYGQRGRKPMRAVHDQLYCNAVVAGDGSAQVAIIGCDMVMVSAGFRALVLAGLAADGFNTDNLLIAASHTHSGPGGMMDNFISGFGFGWYNDKYTRRAADSVITAVKKARAEMQPSTLRVAETTLDDVTRNRRDPALSYDYDTRRFKDAYDPKNPLNDVDPTLAVMRFDGPDGRPEAVLFHFATHGTVMGADNWEFSADWIGAARKKIEAAYPGAVVVYLNGAQGDQAPTMISGAEYNDWQYVDVIGGKIADGVLAVMDQAAPVTATPIRSKMVRREVPPGSRLMGIHVGKWFVKKNFPEIALMGIRLGEVGLMCCPMEIVSEVGRTMKEGARGQGVKYPLVVGLSNEHLLYTASPADFEAGGYEVENTVYGITEPAIIIGEQQMLMRSLFAN